MRTHKDPKMKLLANLLVLATLGFARAEPNTIEEDAYLMVRSSEPLPMQNLLKEKSKQTWRLTKMLSCYFSPCSCFMCLLTPYPRCVPFVSHPLSRFGPFSQAKEIVDMGKLMTGLFDLSYDGSDYATCTAR